MGHVHSQDGTMGRKRRLRAGGSAQAGCNFERVGAHTRALACARACVRALACACVHVQATVYACDCV
eukprot:862553-Pleurochrysis_carterae.AAC.2